MIDFKRREKLRRAESAVRTAKSITKGIAILVLLAAMIPALMGDVHVFPMIVGLALFGPCVGLLNAILCKVHKEVFWAERRCDEYRISEAKMRSLRRGKGVL